MKREDDILNELASWGSPLESMSREMPYVVPENYFNSLCNSVEENIDTEKIVFKWNRVLPYQIPLGYFDLKPAEMLAVAKENTETHALDNANPYRVPAGYFENLAQQILQVAKASEKEKKSRIIPFGRNTWLFARLAAAAVLIAGIGLGSYIFLAKQNPEKTLAKVPENVIREYAQQNMDDFDVYMNVNKLLSSNNYDKYTRHLNTQEIEQYLEETSGQKNID